MRAIAALLLVGALGSCTTAPPEPMRSPDKEAELQQLLAGKVAQAPIACLPLLSDQDMRVIDDSTIAYRDGAARVYVAHMQGLCNGITNGTAVLVTTEHGSSTPCRGDIARTVDMASRMTVGSCAFGTIQPFVRPRG